MIPSNFYLPTTDLSLSAVCAVSVKIRHCKVWQAQRDLMEQVRREEWNDFNAFSLAVDNTLKASKTKLAAAQKNQILNAVSWRAKDAVKVIKCRHKLSADKLAKLLEKLDTTKGQLSHHGYWPTDEAGVYVEYETDSELRDTENVPLKDDIYAYFIREVRPHVKDAWLDMSSVKIGYEISFNRYFYEHKPLRKLEEVAQDILDLEKETYGLLKRLINLTSAEG